MTEPAKPGLLSRLRARYKWLDHTVRAQERYEAAKGDFYAAGITYFTIFALFPLLMVVFAVGGFVLASQPDVLDDIESRIRGTISGDLGQQVVNLMDSAIASRTSVGIIGLATAAWAGLGWMANLREALSQMWLQRTERGGFVGTKMSDLAALLSTFVALIVTIALTALSDTGLMATVLNWFGLHDFPALSMILGVASTVVSFLVAWLLFTWMIARLPRESVSFGSSIRAGLLAAAGFEVFKRVASVYLQSVVQGPAGATFGPVLGLMVFAYITARLVLFATAWAATSRDNMEAAPVDPPSPAIINTRVVTRPGLAPVQALIVALAGVLGALGISRLARRR